MWHTHKDTTSSRLLNKQSRPSWRLLRGGAIAQRKRKNKSENQEKNKNSDYVVSPRSILVGHVHIGFSRYFAVLLSWRGLDSSSSMIMCMNKGMGMGPGMGKCLCV